MRYLTDLESCILRDLTPTVPDDQARALIAAWKSKRGPETVATLTAVGYPADSIARGILIREGLEDVCDECGAVECPGTCEFDDRPSAAWADVGGVA